MENSLDVKRIVSVLKNNAKRIGLITLSVAFTVGLISLLFPNIYKAVTIFYVSSADMATVEHFYGRAKKDLEYFGNDTDIDRMFAVAKSSELFDFLIDSFKLAEHYGIKLKKPRDGYKLYKKTNKHFKLVKNKYNAIELSFEDKDPEFAAKVANAARHKIDELLLNLVREKQKYHIESFRQNLDLKQKNLELLSDTLDSLRAVYGVVNLGTQSEQLSTILSEVESGYLRESTKLEALQNAKAVKRDTIEMIAATVKGLERELAMLKSDASEGNYSIARFNEGRRKIEMVEARYYLAKEHVGYDTERLKQLISAYQAKIPMLMVIEEAAVPVVKHKPIRSLWVLTAGFCTMISMSFYYLIKESFYSFSMQVR